MLDHLVYATPDLDATVADLAARGLPTVPGGPHSGLGSRNHLASFGGGSYLEVIGPDPDQPAPARPRPFGIDALTAPTLVAWCVRPGRPLEDVVADLARAGHDAGEIGDMSRTRPDGVLLEWRLTRSIGVWPFLIDWLGSPHPSETSAAVAVLATFTLSHPDPDPLRRALAAIGDAHGLPDVVAGPEGLRAQLRTSSGSLIDL